MVRKLVIVFLLCCGNMALAQHNAEHTADLPAQTDYKRVGAPMPDFMLLSPTMKKVQTLTGGDKDTIGNVRVLTQKDFDTSGNLFIIMFNPTCEHCEEEAILLIKHRELFKKTKVIFMSAPDMMAYYDYFNAGSHIFSHTDVFTVGEDKSGFIEKTFLYDKLPQINIYDHNRKLLRIFTNETPIDSLKEYIE